MHVAREAHEIEQAIAVGVVFGLVLLGGLLRFDLSASTRGDCDPSPSARGGGFRRAHFSPRLLHVRRALDVLFRARVKREGTTKDFQLRILGAAAARLSVCLSRRSAEFSSSFSESALTIRLSNVSLTASMHSSTSQSTGCSHTSAAEGRRGSGSNIGV